MQKKSGSKQEKAAASDWRVEMLGQIRILIQQADPEVVEEVKWKKASNAMAGVPVWSHDGIICTGETYKNVVKMTFAKGASLPDPSGLFNSSLEGNTRRAIDFHEGDKINEKALKALIRAAVALNTSSTQAPTKPVPAKPALLSGGNPQIGKADGDAPVQAYIAAMPGWKGDVGRRLDALIVKTVPNVRKAVRWNTPFYGIEGNGWFIAFHCITKYIKVTFFRGSSMSPVPPVESKVQEVRYLHIHEDEAIDEKLLTSWIRQASELPGDKCF
jgi:hypothetical protein